MQNPTSREHYRVFNIPKNNGKTRLIEEPYEELKRIQRNFLPLLREFQLHPNVYGLGGVGKDAISNAIVHQHNKVIVKMDIEKFFPNTTVPKYLWTINTSIIDSNLRQGLNSIKDYLFIESRTGLRLPTGAPTSPLVSSITFTPADYDLNHYAKQHNLRYTRYIDDLTFSGNEYPSGLQKEVANIVSIAGYRINHNKSHLLYKGNQTQMITGVCINKSPSVGKIYKRQLRAELDKYAREGLTIDEHIIGKLSYIKQLNFSQYDAFWKYFLKRQNHWHKTRNLVEYSVTNE